MLKALIIHDSEGKPLAEVKELAKTEALNLWKNTKRKSIKVRLVTYFEDLKGWAVVVEHLGG
jgi:hypothetical protein